MNTGNGINNITPNTTSTERKSLFPKKTIPNNSIQDINTILERNDPKRKQELDDLAQQDVKIDIKDAIKDFSRMKKAVDSSSPIDQSLRVQQLKEQVNNGTYKFDYDKLADKLLAEQF